MKAVLKDASALALIPIKKRLKSLCDIAVRLNGSMIACVPKRFIDYPMCVDAVRSQPLALKKVPLSFKSFELCSIAIAGDANALADVPIGPIWIELTSMAIEKDGLALRHVPKDLKSYSRCNRAMISNAEAFRYVPIEFKKGEWCLLAVQQYGTALMDVPPALMTEDLCVESVTHFAGAFQFVPEQLKTLRVCRAAALTASKEGPQWLSFLLKISKPDALFEAVLEKDGLLLSEIAVSRRTDYLCEVAIRQNHLASKFFPPKIAKARHRALDRAVNDLSDAALKVRPSSPWAALI